MSDFPYPGLRPFKRDETDIFFGREELTTQLIDRLDQTHFLAVVGVSGCGKSSLVRTGLLAGLGRGLLASKGILWRIAELRPGNRPFARLAEALLADNAFKKEYTAIFTDNMAEAPRFVEAKLRRGPKSLHELLQKLSQQQDTPLPPKTNLLLIVDQFEELFRHYNKADKNEVAAFVKLLLNSSQHPAIYIVITMRSDFIGDCTWFHGLPEAINNGFFLTPRLTREQLRLAIEGPAKVFGGQVEPSLANQLLNETGDEPDQLPLLQHALMRMWDQARPQGLEQLHYDLEKIANMPLQGRILTLAHYQIGELKNALSQHAEEAYKELQQLAEPAKPQKRIEIQKMAEILFRRICERDPTRRDTRSPVKLEEVAKLVEKRIKLANGIPSWQQIIPVVDVFRQTGRYFLTPPLPIQLKPDSIIDISHESLIHHWQRLKEWTELEAKSVEIYRRLEDSARLWEQNQTALWQSPDLAIALAWREKEQPSAEWANRYGVDFEIAMRFLKESEQEQQRQEPEKEIKRQEALKRVRKQRVWAITITGIIVAIVLAAVGYFYTSN